jgi:steroid delta-isomerase-like uncharacterized protein
MSEENKAIVRDFFLESNRQRHAAEEYLADDFVVHFPGAPPIARATFAQHLNQVYVAFTDTYHDIEDVLAEGDRVAIRVVFHGRHIGEYEGVPASDNEVAVRNTVIGRIENGKIAEWWPSFDTLAMMQQIGALPAPAEAAT